MMTLGYIGYLGDLNYRSKATLPFWTGDATGAPATLTGATAKVTRRSLIPGHENELVESTAGVAVLVDRNGDVGRNAVQIDMSADPEFYYDRQVFEVWLTAGTVGGASAAGRTVGTFSLGSQKPAPISVPGWGAGG
jgi:hypothetical protein